MALASIIRDGLFTNVLGFTVCSQSERIFVIPTDDATLLTLDQDVCAVIRFRTAVP